MRRLLVIGPSYRRNQSSSSLPAVERYDGLFYRVARKYLGNVRDVDVLVMKDDLTLVNGGTPLLYTPPKGGKWGMQTIPEAIVNKATKRNKATLSKKLKGGIYSEVFLAMGKMYAKALPDFSRYNIEVVFPTSGGAGSKAQALKNWMREEITTSRILEKESTLIENL